MDYENGNNHYHGGSNNNGRKMASSSLSTLAAGLFALLLAASPSIIQASYAQYGVGGNPTADATDEQLAECEKYSIPRAECNEHNILAARRVEIARDNPNGGSGTSMISIDAGQMWAFIGVLGAIFGGVAVAFFVRGRKAAGEGRLTA